MESSRRTETLNKPASPWISTMSCRAKGSPDQASPRPKRASSCTTSPSKQSFWGSLTNLQVPTTSPRKHLFSGLLWPPPIGKPHDFSQQTLVFALTLATTNWQVSTTSPRKHSFSRSLWPPPIGKPLRLLPANTRFRAHSGTINWEVSCATSSSKHPFWGFWSPRLSANTFFGFTLPITTTTSHPNNPS